MNILRPSLSLSLSPSFLSSCCDSTEHHNGPCSVPSLTLPGLGYRQTVIIGTEIDFCPILIVVMLTLNVPT